MNLYYQVLNYGYALWETVKLQVFLTSAIFWNFVELCWHPVECPVSRKQFCDEVIEAFFSFSRPVRLYPALQSCFL